MPKTRRWRIQRQACPGLWQVHILVFLDVYITYVFVSMALDLSQLLAVFLKLFFNSFLVLGSICYLPPSSYLVCIYIYVCIHTLIMKKIRIRIGLLVMPMGKHGVAPLTMDHLMEVWKLLYDRSNDTCNLCG